MLTDIVERLRSKNRVCARYREMQCDCCENGWDAADEIERLRSWKAQASTVLDGWEVAWHAAGHPGKLGESKHRATVREIKRLRAENAHLRNVWSSEQAKDAGRKPWACDLCGSADGSWPCTPRVIIDAALDGDATT